MRNYTDCPTDPPCPVAIFNSTWSGVGGPSEYQFDVSVPVVRPIGERSVWLGSQAGLGVTTWQQTLVPPEEDPTFDFAGDCVQESVWDMVNECMLMRPYWGGHGNFIIHPGNYYTDSVGPGGRSPLKTIACTNVAIQFMYFKSQAQIRYDVQPYTASPNFHKISMSTASLPNFNSIRVARQTAFSPNGFTPPIFVDTTSNLGTFPNGNGYCTQ
jgi:hypothetical protein